MLNLLDRIDAHLLQGEAKDRERTAHWASDAAACKRQLFYKWTGEPKTNPITAGALWKMRMGDGVHEMLHQFLVDTGLQIIGELSLRLPPEITGLGRTLSGRIDNVFEDPDSGDLEAIEVKSGYGAGIRALRASGPKLMDMIQALIYLKWGGLKRCHLIYVARDDGYRTAYVLDYDAANDALRYYHEGAWRHTDLTYAAVHQRFQAVEAALEGGETPPRDYWQAIKNGEYRDEFQKDKVKYRSNWQCSYCAYRDKCWGEMLERYADGDNLDMKQGGDDE